MTTEQTKLDVPGSGYDVITKILHAYAECGDKPASLADVATKATLNPTVVSRNNGFLVSLGLIHGGRMKALTPIGKELALNIGNSLEVEVAAKWRDVLLASMAAAPILSMIRVQKTIPAGQFKGKVAHSLGIAGRKGQIAVGINTIIDILLKAGIVTKQNGNIVQTDGAASTDDVEKFGVASPSTPYARTLAVPSKTSETFEQQRGAPAAVPVVAGQLPSVHIDIQIHIAPEATPEQIDKMFESMAKHLYKMT